MTISLKSEEDVRSKIVVPWLLENGFNPNQISLEFSFRIRIGRALVNVYNGETSRVLKGDSVSPTPFSVYTSRADILVKNGEGENLLIIEVKGPNESLDDGARDQGISYARQLAEGNIAPYVLLTNGTSTKVFDTFTRQEIVGADSSLGTKKLLVDPIDFELRAEALEALISFSPGNMIAFCSAQAEYRMKPLMGEDLNSDKKFIPQLFVERPEARTRFARFIDDEKRNVVLLIGHPQVGKTNFVCQTVIDRLSNGQPCLFYPAIGLSESLLTEIARDFEWTFGSVPDTHSLLIRKIGAVLRRLKTKLTIFIDGWNETNIQLARTIDAECSRLSNTQIQIVVTLTNTAATRLLRGNGGNPSFLADEAGISSLGPGLIELDPEEAANMVGWSCVHIKKYSAMERDEAYDKYRKAYRVAVPPNHVRSSDPYMIGVAMKLSGGHSLPETLDEPELLKHMIEKKINRAVGLDDYNVMFSIRQVAGEIFRHGSPVSLENVAKIWGVPAIKKLPDGFFDSALLAKETDKFGMPSIDFYYGRERDYAIAFLSQDWGNRLAAREDMSVEFTNAVRTSAGVDALRWFLKQPAHIRLIQKRDGTIPHYDSPAVRCAMFSSLCEYVYADDSRGEKLAKYAASCTMNDTSLLVRIEALKLVTLITDDAEELRSVLDSGASVVDFVEAVLGIGQEFPLRADSAGRIVLNALRDFHWESDPFDSGESEIVAALVKLGSGSAEYMRRQANTCFGYVAPFAYVEHVAGMISHGALKGTSARLDEFVEGMILSSHELSSSYYGDMCPGSLESICDDPDLQEAEYEKMADVLYPIIELFKPLMATDHFESILKDLGIGLKKEDGNDAAPVFIDTQTLPLPFDT